MNKKLTYGQVAGFKDFKGVEDSEFEMIVTIIPTTEDVDRYNEITDKKAFLKSMPAFMKNPVSMYNHRDNVGLVLKYGTVDNDIYVDIGIAKTVKGTEVAELVRIKALTRSSFQFGKAQYEPVKNMKGVSRLIDFETYEIGLVDIPANDKTSTISFKNYDPNEFIVINEDDQANNKPSRKGSKQMDLEKKKLLETIETIVNPMRGEVDSLKDDYVTMTENMDTQKSLLSEVAEKQTLLSKGRLTKTEFDTFAGKIGGDILDLQKDLKRQIQAGRISSNRRPYTGWKSMCKDVKVVFDDKGTALSDAHQKAYHFLHTPFDFKNADSEGKRLEDLRDLNDIIVISDAYFKRMKGGSYNMEQLKVYKMFRELLKDFDPELEKAMYSTGSGVGDEWVPTEFSSQLHESYELEMELETYIDRWEMPSNSAYYPINGTKPRMYRVNEASVNNPQEMIKSNQNTGNTLFTTSTFGVAVLSSTELMEDSIINIAPAIRNAIAKGMKEGNESRFLNADDTTAGTHMDTDAEWATSTTFPESYEKGFRKHALGASNTLNVQSATAGIGDGTSAFVAQDIRGLRKLMPSGSGHRAKDLVYVTSISVWLDMLSFDQYTQVGTYGANASWLTGDLPSFDGSPLIVSSELSETMSTAGIDDGSALKALVAFNKTDYKVGYRRNVTLEFDKDVFTQQLAFVATQRNSFKSMSASGSEQVAMAINIP